MKKRRGTGITGRMSLLSGVRKGDSFRVLKEELEESFDDLDVVVDNQGVWVEAYSADVRDKVVNFLAKNGLILKKIWGDKYGNKTHLAQLNWPA